MKSADFVKARDRVQSTAATQSRFQSWMAMQLLESRTKVSLLFGSNSGMEDLSTYAAVKKQGETRADSLREGCFTTLSVHYRVTHETTLDQFRCDQVCGDSSIYCSFEVSDNCPCSLTTSIESSLL